MDNKKQVNLSTQKLAINMVFSVIAFILNLSIRISKNFWKARNLMTQWLKLAILMVMAMPARELQIFWKEKNTILG